MQVSANYFNAHANGHRIMGTKATNSLGVIHQANPAPAIIKADEVAYSRAQEKAKFARRNVKVSLAELPW